MINRTAAQILITSSVKAYTIATKTGKLNTSVIALYNMLAYYLEFTRGIEEWNQTHAFLLDKMNSLVYQHPIILCNYKSKAPIGTFTSLINTAPTVSDNVIDIAGNTLYQFKVSDLTLNYNDAENHRYKFIVVNPLLLNANGTLTTGSTGTVAVNNPIIINIEGKASSDLINLFYNRTNLSAFGVNDYFNFRVSDNPINYLYSASHKIDIYASVGNNETNAPATVGDITIYKENRATTILTLAMFTSSLTPPYNDPEADLIDAIRIDEVSTANVGEFYFNGNLVQVGDIITREDLIAELLIHTAPNIDAISSDVINFSARDEGSLIWVN
jgi:hypothetical protein